jgi:hemerythrin-like domain-containing protein
VPDTAIDVSEMFAVHDGMRKEYGSLPLLVKSIADGDRDRASIVCDHVHLLAALMQAHHEGEDELLWPLARERAPETESIFATGAEHVELAEHLARIAAQADAWRSDPSSVNRATLHTSLIRFERILLQHLGHEEADVLPVLRQIVTQDEFASVGRRVRESFPADQRAILLGLILQDTTPTLGAALLEAMDPEDRAEFESSGRTLVQAYRARLLST